MAKYPIKQSLKNLADIVSKQVSQVESDLKSKVSLIQSVPHHSTFSFGL